MSADRLREAAKVLRERATSAAESADWSDETLAEFMATRRIAVVAKSEQRYLATFANPGVGLALADWLDNEGHILYDLARVSGETARQCAPAAHAIADLILGSKT